MVSSEILLIEGAALVVPQLQNERLADFSAPVKKVKLDAVRIWGRREMKGFAAEVGYMDDFFITGNPFSHSDEHSSTTENRRKLEHRISKLMTWMYGDVNKPLDSLQV
ncbi:hypothetical protein Y032_0020g21 [Ancylostoma ceylanicum]|uniref:Uncharacterized protein n=1 Tax=Ancylostoma ceylanicum TaxID=53326 RepID=A0A016V261_9BILA|nr:hypothetical protein Y032_0020g21 [Ancylostoma ceylanicum]